MKRTDEYTSMADDEVRLLVDRMIVINSRDAIGRPTDPAGIAMYEGDGTCMLCLYLSDGIIKLRTFSTKFKADGIIFEEPNDWVFSLNSPVGVRPVYEGSGKVISIDKCSVIPNHSLPVCEGVIICWCDEKMGERREELTHSAKRSNFPIFTPYYKLTDAQRYLLWKGNQYSRNVDDFFKMLEESQYKI